MKRFWKIVAVVAGLLVAAIGIAVAYAAATFESRYAFSEIPYPELKASPDPAVIAQGRYLVHGPAHCSMCHSTAKVGHPEEFQTAPLEGGFEFALGPLGSRYASNLTPHAETGIGRWTDAEVARAIRTGVMPDGELSFFMSLSIGRLSDEDVVAVISYLRSLEPRRNAVPAGEWKLTGKVLLTYVLGPLEPRLEAAPAHVPPADEPTIERGRYVSIMAACVNCHSGRDPETLRPAAPLLAGGVPEASHGEDGDMEFVAPNLTSHPTGITGRLDEDAFVARLRGGRAYPSSIMPWEPLAATTESDLRSLYRYLRSLPPVDNSVGPTYRKKGWKADG